MKLIVMRHGQAENPRSNLRDSDRRLTPEGVVHVTDMARLLKSQLPTPPDAILCSPFFRATQTAEIISSTNSWETPIIEPDLSPGMSPENARETLLSYNWAKTIMIIAHNPDLELFIADLLRAHDEALHMVPGSAAVLEVGGRIHQGRLRALFRPPPNLELA